MCTTCEYLKITIDRETKCAECSPTGIQSSGNSKHCCDCKEDKPLTEFYKAGRYRQKRCKVCHNMNRYKYKNSTSKYAKKKIGFKGLPEEKRNNILKNIKYCKEHNIKINYSKLSKLYDIPYSSITYWKKKDLIK